MRRFLRWIAFPGDYIGILVLVGVVGWAGVIAYADYTHGQRSLVHGEAFVRHDIRVHRPQKLIYSADGSSVSPAAACTVLKDTPIELMGTVGDVTIGHVMQSQSNGCDAGMLVAIPTNQLTMGQFASFGGF